MMILFQFMLLFGNEFFAVRYYQDGYYMASAIYSFLVVLLLISIIIQVLTKD